MPRLSIWFFCLIVAAAALAGCTRPGAGQLPADSAQAKPSEYIIGSGDTLAVFVYQSPDLSQNEVAVRPDGKISIPLVQDIQAAGLTPPQLAENIAQRLKQYVKDPHVTVIIKSFVGPFDRQIKVIGEATDPKAIPYRDGMRVLDVLVDTKGLTKYAAGNRAIIVRRDGTEPNGNVKTSEIHVRLGDLINDGDLSQNVRMQPGDTLIIPQSWF